MKRLFILLLLLSSAALAQRSTVTAIVQSPDGTLWPNCRGSASLVETNPISGQGPSLTDGSSFQKEVLFNCDSFGSFTINVTDNLFVLPTGTQWGFNIQNSTGLTSYRCALTITGATQNITSALQACAPANVTPTSGPSLPNSCVQPQTYFKTTSPGNGLYQCITWPTYGGIGVGLVQGATGWQPLIMNHQSQLNSDYANHDLIGAPDIANIGQQFTTYSNQTPGTNTSASWQGGGFHSFLTGAGVNYTGGQPGTGFTGDVRIAGNIGTVTSVMGGQFVGISQAGGGPYTSGTITKATGLYVRSVASSASNIMPVVTGHAIYAASPLLTGATLTNSAGLTSEEMVGATNNTDLLLGTATVPSGQWAINSVSTRASKLAGPLSTTAYSTANNCAVNSVSPAACGSAPAGAFVIPTTTTTYTVNTTAITAASRVLLLPRTYAGDLPSTPTCVTPVATTQYNISAISAGTSFTVALGSTTGQTCFNYWVVN